MTTPLRTIHVLSGALIVTTLIAYGGAGRLAFAQQPAAAPAADSATIAAEIERLTQRLTDALEKNDVAVLDSLVAPDSWIVRPNGERHRKAEWLASFTSGSMKFTRYDHVTTVTHVHGDDVAVSVQEANQGGTLHTGAPLPERVVATRIWVSRGGAWQVVLNSIAPVTVGGAR